MYMHIYVRTYIIDDGTRQFLRLFSSSPIAIATYVLISYFAENELLHVTTSR